MLILGLLSRLKGAKPQSVVGRKKLFIFLAMLR